MSYIPDQQARVGIVVKTDGSIVNENDGINPDGSRNVQITGSYVKQAIMLPVNTVATGIGTPQAVGTLKTLRIEVWGTGTYTLQIQGIGASGTPRNLPVWDNINRAFLASNNIVAAGFYDIDVQGYTSAQANVSAISGGNVNASGMVMA